MLFDKTSRLKIFLTVLLMKAFIPTAYSAEWETKENCDMASKSLAETKTASREECQQRCSDAKECQGIVYITGWKKCSLKADVKRHADLRFISGELDAKHEYQAGSFKVDHDHNGKDLQRLVLDKPDQCGQACAAKAECSAFTYLEGYRVCWLKKAGGHLSAKVFSCSFKKG